MREVHWFLGLKYAETKVKNVLLRLKQKYCRPDILDNPLGRIVQPLGRISNLRNPEKLCWTAVSSQNFQNRSSLCPFFIFFNYLQNDGLLHSWFITDQTGATGAHPGFHLNNFDWLRGVRPDSELDVSRV